MSEMTEEQRSQLTREVFAQSPFAKMAPDILALLATTLPKGSKLSLVARLPLGRDFCLVLGNDTPVELAVALTEFAQRTHMKATHDFSSATTVTAPPKA
jgi:hypothetical protein